MEEDIEIKMEPFDDSDTQYIGLIRQLEQEALQNGSQAATHLIYQDGVIIKMELQTEEENEATSSNLRQPLAMQQDKQYSEAPQAAVPASAPVSVPASARASVPVSVPVSLRASVAASVPPSIPLSIPASLLASVPASVRASARASVPISVPASVRASVPASARTSVPVSVPASLRASVPPSVRVSVPASVRASVPVSVPSAAPITAVAGNSKDDQNSVVKPSNAKQTVRKRKQVFFNETCADCHQSFNIQRVFDQHKESGLCIVSEEKIRCTVCSQTFTRKSELEHHLELHKLNRFFCLKNCGKSFDSLENCQMHEFKFHQMPHIKCSVCNQKFHSCNALSYHIKSHSALKRFVCSFCRDWFPCSIDLAKHWQLHKSSCGRLMQDVVEKSMRAIEMTLPSFTETAKTPPKKRCKTSSKASSTCGDKTSLSSSFVTLNDVSEHNTDQNDISNVAASTQKDASSTSHEVIASVEIKTEPVDAGYDVVLNIKSEPLSEDEGDVNGANDAAKWLDDENKLSTTFQQENAKAEGEKFVPAAVPAQGNIAQPTMRNIKIVHLPNQQQPPSIAVKPLQLQNQNVTVQNVNLTSYKIIKRIPNGKFLRLPVGTTVTKSPAISNTPPAGTIKNVYNQPMNMINMEPTGFMALKLKQPPMATVTNATNANANTNGCGQQMANVVETRSNPHHLNLGPSLPPRKNNCKSKTELQLIENQPQKRALIESLKQQIKKYVGLSEDGGNTSDTNVILPKPIMVPKYGQISVKQEFVDNDFLEQAASFDSRDDDDDDDRDGSLIIDESDHLNELTQSSCDAVESASTSKASLLKVALTNRKTQNYPPTFFINVITACDPDLQAARRKFDDYRYMFKCPRCPRMYCQKYAFRGHLVGTHGFCKEEFNKLIVEAKAYPIAKSLEELYNSSTEGQKKQQKKQQKEQKKKKQQQPRKPQPQNTDAESSVSSFKEPSTQKSDNENAGSSPNRADDSDEGANNGTKHRSKYTCPQCGRVCSTRTALNDHILAKCGREPQYPCAMCPKRFFSASTLSQHMSIHTGELPHQCSFCDKRFRTRGQVTVHHRTHTGERPFACQVCNQCFTHRETLISHLSRHIGMKRYKCYGCGQKFACISGLKTHRDVRYSSCGKVKLNTRAVGPRVRVVKGSVVFEPQPNINPYLRTEDPKGVLAEIKKNSTH